MLVSLNVCRVIFYYNLIQSLLIQFFHVTNAVIYPGIFFDYYLPVLILCIHSVMFLYKIIYKIRNYFNYKYTTLISSQTYHFQCHFILIFQQINVHQNLINRNSTYNSNHKPYQFFQARYSQKNGTKK